MKLKAYCDSQACTQEWKKSWRARKIPGAVRIEKDVKFSETFCPDCGAALLWDRPNFRQRNYPDQFSFKKHRTRIEALEIFDSFEPEYDSIHKLPKMLGF